jgi:hypothetical protein
VKALTEAQRERHMAAAACADTAAPSTRPPFILVPLILHGHHGMALWKRLKAVLVHPRHPAADPPRPGGQGA